MTAPGVLDIGAALLDLLEPDPTPPALPTVTKDETGEEPFAWAADTLYLYPIRNAETPIETGPTARQDFAFLAVFVADSHEEARHRRKASISSQLDAKRVQYMNAVRNNRVTSTWHHIRASERPNPPRTLQSRAVAIEISGFRIVS